MKKIKILLGVIVLSTILFLVTACGEESEEIEVTPYYKEINYARFDEIVKEKNDVKYLIYLQKPDCSYCTLFKPKLKEVSEELEIIVYSLDTSELSSAEKEEISEYIDGFTGTPTTIIMQNSKLVDKIVGNKLKGDIKTFLNENYNN